MHSRYRAVFVFKMMFHTFTISIWPDLIQLSDRDLPCHGNDGMPAAVLYIFPNPASLSVTHHQPTRLGARMGDGMGSDLVDFYVRSVVHILSHFYLIKPKRSQLTVMAILKHCDYHPHHPRCCDWCHCSRPCNHRCDH